MPVLLAFKGLENKTDCVGSLTNVDWSVPAPDISCHGLHSKLWLLPYPVSSLCKYSRYNTWWGVISLDQTGCALISGALGVQV